MRTLAPDLEVLAPVRDQAFRRADELEYLRARHLPVPPSGAAYSINRGLWGVTIGGQETLTSSGSIPDDAWVFSRDAFRAAARTRPPHTSFVRGRPCALDGKRSSRSRIIEALEALGGSLWHRPRDPSGRYHHRYQGTGRI